MGLWSSKPVPYSDVCSVCLEPRPDEIKTWREKQYFIKADCNHIFHKECLEKVLLQDNLCPVCRKSISDVDMKKKKYKYDSTIETEETLPLAYLTDGYFTNEQEDEYDTLRFV